MFFKGPVLYSIFRFHSLFYILSSSGAALQDKLFRTSLERNLAVSLQKNKIKKSFLPTLILWFRCNLFEQGQTQSKGSTDSLPLLPGWVVCTHSWEGLSPLWCHKRADFHKYAHFRARSLRGGAVKRGKGWKFLGNSQKVQSRYWETVAQVNNKEPLSGRVRMQCLSNQQYQFYV